VPRSARAGKGVTIAVIDTGVGRHGAVNVIGGRNTTTESRQRYSDWDGHGTHVAGVIASAAAGWRRDEAPGVSLRAYRIFEEGDDVASAFAISAAIKQAALDGCALIKHSTGGAEADGAVRDAIDQAWELESVCIAATGNDARRRSTIPPALPKPSPYRRSGSRPAGRPVPRSTGR
jgi:minor extracellular protease Epr